MLVEGLLEKIGFDDSMIAEYNKYNVLLSGKIAPYTKAYFNGEKSIYETLKELQQLATDGISKHTVDLMFVLDCTGYYLQNCINSNVPYDVFLTSMKDIKYKTDECKNVKGVFGTFVADWYNGFFRHGRVGLGRLQYDPRIHSGEKITVGDFTLNPGDFVLGCHIPSAGPLKRELCEESYGLAYQYFKEKLKDGILAIHCGSWLLYPPYIDVFGKESNTAKFAADFHIYQSDESETFGDAWRVFGVDYNGNTDILPSNTRMQQGFIDYLKKGGTVGAGRGIILYDGKRVLTRRTL